MNAQQIRRIRGTRAWRRLSQRVIHEERICWLRLPGCTLVATTSDHVIPIIIRPDLALVRSNVHAACASCNYKRGTTPVSELAELRRRTPKQLDARRVHKYIAKRKPAAATNFFNTR